MMNAMHRMKYIFILLFILSGAGLYAQVDNPTGGIAIPKSKTPIAPTAPAKAETPSKEAQPKKSFMSYDLGGKGLSMEKKNDFVSRGAEFEDKANASVRSKGESNAAFRGHQFFGELTTKSQYLNVLASDYGLQDGDRIKVLINDRVVIEEFTLTNNSKALQLMLSPGFNKIDFEAMNQGTSGPNTAEFAIYDDKEKLLMSNQWNLATGFKASVMVIKE